MPCYVATGPSSARACAPRQHPAAAYHHGLGPWVVRGGASPFADLTATLQPFFKLLDEELTAQTPKRLRSFQPRFDVREEPHAFTLLGELPGIDQEDIAIEFKDEHTLVVRGRTARESQSSAAKEQQPAGTDAMETEKSATDNADAASETGSNYHQPTVEDEFVDVGAESEKPAAAAPSTEEKGKQAEKPAAEAPKDKYWVSERSVGQFHRSFTFPGHVDQEAVTANLKNGILTVVVPKAQQKEPRRIAIE